MPLESITLTRSALASLAATFTGTIVKGDDGDTPPAGSIWGPIIRRAIRSKLAPGEPIPWQTAAPGEQVGINPQPLPPRWLLLAATAGAVREFLEQGIIFVGGMDAGQQEKALGHAKGLVSRMIDDCGNGKFFPWKPKNGGPIIPDGGDPGWGAEVMVFGLALEREAVLVSDTDLRGLLHDAAGILTEQGADRLNQHSATAS
jgi:hypothetical protein